MIGKGRYSKKLSDTTDADDIKNVKIIVPLKFFSNFWRFLQISITNFEINRIITLSEGCFISKGAANETKTFEKPITKLYVPFSL